MEIYNKGKTEGVDLARRMNPPVDAAYFRAESAVVERARA